MWSESTNQLQSSYQIPNTACQLSQTSGVRCQLIFSTPLVMWDDKIASEKFDNVIHFGEPRTNAKACPNLLKFHLGEQLSKVSAKTLSMVEGEQNA